MTYLTPLYLDYAATTPVDSKVIQKMNQCLTMEGAFGNAASKHSFGDEARQIVEVARQQVADLVHAVPRNILFTSGATESNNLAIKGIAHFYKDRGDHIVTCKTEHKSVLDVYAYLEQLGFSVTYLNINRKGLIDLNELESSLQKETILVSIMHANNETGVLQDIQAIGEITRARGIFFHVDAAQSLGKIPIDLQKLPVDLMSFSAHKIYGPKGIGALYLSDSPRVRLVPLLHGGGQERKLRAGTLPTHQIAGLGEAAQICGENMQMEFNRMKSLRQRFWGAMHTIPEVYLNGDEKFSLPNILNIRFQNKDKEFLLKHLSNLAISSASACNSINIEPSHVLKAMGLKDIEADRSFRFSFGRFTTESELDYAIDLIYNTLLKEE